MEEIINKSANSFKELAESMNQCLENSPKEDIFHLFKDDSLIELLDSKEYYLNFECYLVVSCIDKLILNTINS